MDARGRSRTYQAILDFYRSTLTASLILLVVYSAYTCLTVEGHITIESMRYQSHLGALNIDWTYIIAATLSTSWITAASPVIEAYCVKFLRTTRFVYLRHHSV